LFEQFASNCSTAKIDKEARNVKNRDGNEINSTASDWESY